MTPTDWNDFVATQTLALDVACQRLVTFFILDKLSPDMKDTDAFFTHTIVGPPMSVLLGRRIGNSGVSVDGVVVHLADGENRLSPSWREWVLSTQACEKVGQPRMRPGRTRQLLERHAFWIAALGLASLAGTAGYWGFMQWT